MDMDPPATILSEDDLPPAARTNRRDSVIAAIPPHADFIDEYLERKYAFVRLLGRGSYGSVAEARCIATGRRVAIKHVRLGNLIDMKRLLREIRILRQLRHESLVDLLDLITASNAVEFDSLYIVLEFVDTDLGKLIRSDQFFSELHIKFIMYQILIGALAMHTAGVCHRDFKPANVLVNEDVSVKICDFGLSRVIETPSLARTSQSEGGAKVTAATLSRHLTKHVVTRWYRAPELILLYGTYSTAIDMWSIGCIFAELLSMMQENGASAKDRMPLFPGGSCFPMSAETPMAYADRFDQLNMIFDVIGTPTAEDIKATNTPTAQSYLNGLEARPAKDLASVYPGATREVIDLLQKFLLFNPRKRITIDEAISHPFFETVRDVALEASIRSQIPLTFEFEEMPLDKEILCEFIRAEVRHFHPTFGLPTTTKPTTSKRNSDAGIDSGYIVKRIKNRTISTSVEHAMEVDSACAAIAQ